ncbi:MAG: hypothetical protein PHX78_05305 [bacterium]|nr:hypothetical protein [bacterium]
MKRIIIIFFTFYFCFAGFSLADEALGPLTNVQGEGLIPSISSEDQQSLMDISGRKLIRFTLDEQKFSSPYQPNKYGFKIDQELQVRIYGVARRKLFFDIDYDDTREDKNKNRISAIYVGDDDEIVQRAAFGYIPLNISETEFIAYNKTTFGLYLETQFDADKTFKGKKDYTEINYPDHIPPPVYPNLKIKALATFSETQSERKEFSGTFAETKKDIKDAEYIKNRYYRVYENINELPIKDVKIYLDDRNSANNFNTDHFIASGTDGSNYEGEFDELKSGNDYTFDEKTGKISFFIQIQENYVIAVNYNDASGKRYEHKIIRDQNDSEYFWRYRVRNIYFLGSKNIDPRFFSLKIIDLFGREKDPNTSREYIDILGLDNDPKDGRIDPKNIDYDYGILIFPGDLPFQVLNPSIYTKTPVPEFILNVNYRAYTKEYFLRPGIVTGSEKIYLKQKLLARGVDYNIDYNIGLLTFLIKIEEDAKIIADYEYFPFGTGSQSTIMGVRAEYEPTQNLAVGATYIAENGLEMKTGFPQAKESPNKDIILGVDANIKFNIEDMHVNILGEIAKSSFDPNTNNRLSINNMEEDKVSDEISTNTENWSVVSSNPAGEISRSDFLEINEINISHDEEESGRSLYLKNQGSNWAGTMYSFSKKALDFSKREYIEIWIKSDTKSGILNIDMGQINEDMNGNGVLDTEDKDGDGKLGKDEDTGFDYYGELAGKGNKKLDTEDLDGDGFLETNDNYFNFQLDLTNFPNNIDPQWLGRSENGFTLLSIPLSSASKTGAADWELVKYLRLWLKGGGDVTINTLQVVGRSWDVGKVKLANGTIEENERFAVRLNNEGGAGIILDNSELLNNNYVNYSLMMAYSLRSKEEGSTQWDFSELMDFSSYRALHFWLKQDAGQAADDEVFFIRLGVDEDNYYEFTTPVKDIPNSWDYDGVDIGLDDADGDKIPDGLKRTGNLVSLYKIKFIRVGVRNPGSDVPGKRKIYLDEIMLKDRIKKSGEARKVSLKTELEDKMDLFFDFRQWDQDFKTIGRDMETQKRDMLRAISNITFLEFLPITLNLEKENKAPKEDKYGVLSLEELNETKSSKGGVNAALKLPKNPRFLTFNYEDNNTKEISLQRKTNQDIYTYGFEYNIPQYTLIDRLKFNLGLKRFREAQDYEMEGFSRFHNSDNRSLGIGYSPVKYLDMDYSWRKIKEITEESGWYPLNRDQWGGVNIEPFKNLNGLHSRIKSSVDYKERFLTGSEAGSKNANIAGEAEWQLDARPSNWWRNINPLSFSQTVRARKSAIFDNINNGTGFSTLVKKLRDGIITGQDLSAKEITMENYYALGSRYNLSTPLVVNARYSLGREKQTIFESIFNTRTRISSAGMNYDLKSDLYFWDRITEYANLSMDYSHKKILKDDISEKTVSNPSFSFLAGWTKRFSTNYYFSYREEKENVYSELRVKELKAYEPNLELIYKFDLPRALRFAKRQIDFTNRARWRTGLKMEIINTKDYVEYDSSRKYNYNTKFDYDLTEFVTFNISFDYEIFKNKSQLEKDYSLLKVSSECVITF